MTLYKQQKDHDLYVLSDEIYSEYANNDWMSARWIYNYEKINNRKIIFQVSCYDWL